MCIRFAYTASAMTQEPEPADDEDAYDDGSDAAEDSDRKDEPSPMEPPANPEDVKQPEPKPAVPHPENKASHPDKADAKAPDERTPEPKPEPLIRSDSSASLSGESDQVAWNSIKEIWYWLSSIYEVYLGAIDFLIKKHYSGSFASSTHEAVLHAIAFFGRTAFVDP